MTAKKPFLNISIFVGALILFFHGSVFALDLPVHYKVVTFGGGKLWQASEMYLSPTGQGRYKTVKTEGFRLGGTCTDILSEFQKRPLEVMKLNGYITPDAYKFLMDHLKEKIEARAFLLVTPFSQGKKSDVMNAYPKLDRARIMKEWTDQKGETWIWISRGTLFAVRGQVLEPTDSKAPKLSPRQVPWELDKPLGSNLTRPFDREKVPYVVEVGRAFSESDILPGDLKSTVHILMNTLQTEFAVLGVSPKKVVITGHFLDAGHTTFFIKNFPLRPLDSDLQKMLETDLDGTLASYLSSPLPKNKKERAKLKNTVTFGSLEEMLKTFPAEDVSKTAADIHRISDGKVSPERALNMVIQFFGILRDDYDFYYEPNSKSRGPLTLWNWGSAITSAKFYELFRKEGLVEGDPAYQRMADYLGALPYNPGLDAFTETQIDPYMYIRMKSSEYTEVKQRLEITNIDDQMAMAEPSRYFASILLSIADHLRAQIENASPEGYRQILLRTNERRVKDGLKEVPDVNIENYLETFPLAIGTANDAVLEQLLAMGGVKTITEARTLRLTEDRMGFEGSFGQGYFVQFDMSQIKALGLMYKDLDKDARNRLRPGAHNTRLRLLAGAYK